MILKITFAVIQYNKDGYNSYVSMEAENEERISCWKAQEKDWMHLVNDTPHKTGSRSQHN